MVRWSPACLAALGGGAALVTEIAFVRQLEQLFGVTSLAVTASFGAFLVAMGLGSLWASLLIERRRAVLGRALALLQLLGLVWALAAPWILGAIAGATDQLLSGVSSMGFVAYHYVIALSLLLLPGLIAGALVPLLSELVASGDEPGRVVAQLLGWDAVGGMSLALVTGLFILRELGSFAALALAGLLHLLAALIALGLSRSEGLGSSSAGGDRPASSAPGARRPSRKAGRPAAKGGRPPAPRGAVASGWVLLQLAVAGAAGIGWQALWGRLLVLSLPGSVAWPSIMLACWVGAAGLGALAYHRLAWLRARPLVTLGVGQVLCVAGAWSGAALGAWLREWLSAARPISSPEAAELLVAALVTLPAALAMGVLLPSAIDLLRPAGSGVEPVTDRLRPAGSGVGPVTGRAQALDMAGAALATMAVPLWLIPQAGLLWGLLALGLVQAGSGLALLWTAREGLPGGGWTQRAIATALLLAGLGAFLVQGADLRPWQAREPGQARSSTEAVRVVWGPAATAAVVEDPGGTLRLVVDRHHGMGGEQGVFIERRQAHLPLLLQGRQPRSLAVLGLGTGNTVGAATRHSSLRQIDAAESLPSVLQVLGLFATTNHQLWRDDRVRIHLLDGRVMLRRSRHRYDVILSDLVHPWRAGAAGLYSIEHLRQVRAHLAPGGIFCLWLPLHQLDLGDLSIVAATFLEAFGDGTALLGHLGWREPILALIAGGSPEMLARERLEAILGDQPPELLQEVDLGQPEDIQSLFMGDRRWLRALAEGAEVTSLDRPILAYRSAETWWRGIDGLGQRTLAALLERRGSVEAVLPGDEVALRRARAVTILLRAELAEASGDHDAALTGYQGASEADPSFLLPGLALELLQGRGRPDR